MEKCYSIGVDYGSLSARAVLMDLDTGVSAASAVYEYPHGIMTEALPDGTPLPADWALQDPADYWEALHVLIPALLRQTGAAKEQVADIGLDVTSCTVLPTTADGTPLCRLEAYRSRPHAYLKLWKHHAAQPWADRILALAKERNAPWLQQFGGLISGEHYLPKAAQIAAESPDIYQAADRLVEAGDWLVWMLCGTESRNYCAAAFKTYYRPGQGDVDTAFLSSIHPLLADLKEKLPPVIHYPGDRAGGLTAEAADWLGLLPGTAVSAAGVDAHVTLYGSHINQAGDLLLIIGTSTCIILQSDVYREIRGLNGVVPEGILPGLHAYEGGQACVGDSFAWFAERCVPAAYQTEATEQGIGIHQLLMEKAAALAPGENGLVALDWWNGVRSTLMDFDLSGLMVGLTLDTTPEAIYRALLESTAYGARRIIQSIEEAGVPVRTLYAAGGIPAKNPLLAQIYADVCDRDVCLVEEAHSGALGSAILGAAAAGGGFHNLSDLIERYHRSVQRVFHPVPEHAEVYRKLYALYSQLYETYGVQNDLMKQLKQIRLNARRQSAI